YFKDETISTKSMKAAYIREQYYDIRIVSLNTPSLKFYRNKINILFNKPKEKWRDIIKAYQACVQNIQNSLPLYSSITVPLDFEERYNNRNKKKKNSDDVKVTFINEARNFKRFDNKTQTLHYKELYNISTVFIYGERKHKEKLEEIAELFKFQRFSNYEPIYI